MKTAMQELITHLEMLKSRVDLADIDSIIEYANSSLEKEKEQIIDAHINGQSDHHFSLESRTLEAEQHYNQTYNQNK